MRLTESLVYLKEMRASAHCAKHTTEAVTQGVANLGNPFVTCQGCCPYRCFSHFIQILFYFSNQNSKQISEVVDENGLRQSEEQLLLDLPQPSTAASVTSALIYSTESQNAPASNS
jgi:hypothetical protein